MPELSLVWLRRDLRLHDNAALYHALRSGRPVLPVFIFDKLILDALDDRRDRRVEFIYQEISRLRDELAAMGSTLIVRYGTPLDVWNQLLTEYEIGEVFTNRDYEAYAQERDAAIGGLLREHGAGLELSKDQVIFEGDEVLTGGDTPYTVFTPYSRRWKQTLTDFHLKSYPCERYFSNFYKTALLPIPSLAEMGFEASGEPFPAREASANLLRGYADRRNFPAVEGSSRLGIHLRFGTVSIRELARQAQAQSETFLSELIWRDFYFQILQHFPHVGRGRAFRPAYDRIDWRNDEAEFTAWCEGRTGYPIVDAGMRQLNALGWMHNRVRMITASFLIKHLLIDWRWGEAYFAKKLLDYDFAANNGGWQWAAGSGTDAAPYFRVFNPTLQTQKFDPQLAYVKHWVPELNTLDYPRPIVPHEVARERVLKVYKEALSR
ncbi:MAG: deoxyribodipyrimidine photo-lyase [Sphingobacteriaceae bacterium]|nr:deoxyribodipyrimidine photo-lyase [Cytophagaceae bacterium]